MILPLESKQELVHFNNTKVCASKEIAVLIDGHLSLQIKVKCRRLSTEPESSGQSSAAPVGKLKQGASSSGMKLTIKTSLSGCRKPTDDRQLSPIINKKKTSRPTPSAKQTKRYEGKSKFWSSASFESLVPQRMTHLRHQKNCHE